MDPNLDYQMPSYTTLMVNDLGNSTHWYCDILGFSLIAQMPGPNGAPFMSDLRWAPHADLILVGEGPNIFLSSSRGTGITLNFTALRESVDAIANRVRTSGTVQVSGPHNRPWNAREVIIIDPDGYRLNFTKTLRKPLDGNDLKDQIAELFEEGALN